MRIEDGTGSGYFAKVTPTNRISVASRSDPAQHVIASENRNTFQLIGTASWTADSDGSYYPLHLKNTGTDTQIVITYLRYQFLDNSGGTALPSQNTAMYYGYGLEYSSGGNLGTVVNMTAGSAKTATVSAYVENPTLTGSLTTFDRWYTKDEGEMNSFRKEGAAIILPGNTFSMKMTTDHTTGFVYARMSFFVEPVFQSAT